MTSNGRLTLNAAVLTFFLLFATSSPASVVKLKAGGGSTGGGDNPPADQDSAWFVGSKPIRYCTEMAPGFGVSLAAADEMIRGAFQTWKAYAYSHEIFLMQDPKIDFTFQPINVCDGSEI